MLSSIPALALAPVVALALLLTGCSRATDLGILSGSPLDELPEWITPLLDSGMRPDWSPDGRRLIYLDELVGNVYELVYRNSANQTASQNDVEQGWVQFYDLWNNTLIPGASVDIQAWYRDPANPGGANLTNAGTFVMCP